MFNNSYDPMLKYKRLNLYFANKEYVFCLSDIGVGYKNNPFSLEEWYILLYFERGTGSIFPIMPDYYQSSFSTNLRPSPRFFLWARFRNRIPIGLFVSATGPGSWTLSGTPYSKFKIIPHLQGSAPPPPLLRKPKKNKRNTREKPYLVSYILVWAVGLNVVKVALIRPTQKKRSINR